MMIAMYRRACLALAWGLIACGRIGFEPTTAGDASGEAAVDAASDAAFDASAFCEYLPTCMTGQITCCTDTGSFCTLDGPGVCDGGRKVLCSIFTQQGCPPGWACCSTQQRPEASCYTPQLPQPC
jgi:hypothetical protein